MVCIKKGHDEDNPQHDLLIKQLNISRQGAKEKADQLCIITPSIMRFPLKSTDIVL